MNNFTNNNDSTVADFVLSSINSNAAIPGAVMESLHNKFRAGKVNVQEFLNVCGAGGARLTETAHGTYLIAGLFHTVELRDGGIFEV